MNLFSHIVSKEPYNALVTWGSRMTVSHAANSHGDPEEFGGKFTTLCGKEIQTEDFYRANGNSVNCKRCKAAIAKAEQN